VAIHKDRSLRHVKESADEIHHRGLARAAVSDEADHFARHNVQVEIKNDLAGAVLEIDTAEFDFAAQLLDGNGIRRLGDAGLAVENLEDAAGAVGGFLR